MYPNSYTYARANLAAIKTMTTEGIQRGPISLHARNLTAVAGAKCEIIETFVFRIVKEKNVRLEYAKELLKEYSGNK